MLHQCPMCDEWYNPLGDRAAIHEHPEPQSGPLRHAWLMSGLSWEDFDKVSRDTRTRGSNMKVTKIQLFENTAAGGSQVEVTVLGSVDESLGDVLEKLELAVDAGSGEAGLQVDAGETPKRGRRRRGKEPDGSGPAEEPEPEEEEEPKPKRPRRRRQKTDETSGNGDDSGGEEEKPTRRRRRTKKEPSGPTKEDVAKAASDGAEALGPELLADIIADYSDTGKIDDIPEDKRAKFIEDVQNEMSAED